MSNRLLNIGKSFGYRYGIRSKNDMLLANNINSHRYFANYPNSNIPNPGDHTPKLKNVIIGCGFFLAVMMLGSGYPFSVPGPSNVFPNLGK